MDILIQRDLAGAQLQLRISLNDAFETQRREVERSILADWLHQHSMKHLRSFLSKYFSFRLSRRRRSFISESSLG